MVFPRLRPSPRSSSLELRGTMHRLGSSSAMTPSMHATTLIALPPRSPNCASILTASTWGARFSISLFLLPVGIRLQESVQHYRPACLMGSLSPLWIPPVFPLLFSLRTAPVALLPPALLPDRHFPATSFLTA